jgi:hypothetical protein
VDLQALALVGVADNIVGDAELDARNVELVHLLEHIVDHGVGNPLRHAVVHVGARQLADVVDPLLLDRRNDVRLDAVDEGVEALRDGGAALAAHVTGGARAWVPRAR